MRESININHKIWGIAWPAILSNISIPLLGLVDAAILGHLGNTQYLGAVAIGSTLLSFLYWGFGFLRMGTTGLVARAIGAADHNGATLVLAQSSVLALALALGVLVALPLWLQLGFFLMQPQQELQALASSYTSIRIYSAPAVLLTYTSIGWFIGQQNTRWPMVVVIVTNATNIILDFILIVGFDLKSDGAAMATVVAEYLGCALALYGVFKRLPRPMDKAIGQQLRRWSAYAKLLQNNSHLFVRTMCLLGSFAFFTAMGNKLGSDVLAANALMMQLVMLAAYGMDGFAFAAEGLAGQRLGGRDLPGFYLVVRYCSYWCCVTAGIMSLIFLVLHPVLFSLLTDIPEVLLIMRQALVWLVVLPLIAAPSYLLDGVFIGSAETRYMMNTMLVSVALVYIPAWYMTQGWGNSGLWLAFTAFNAARGATLFWCYLRISRNSTWLKTSEPVTKE